MNGKLIAIAATVASWLAAIVILSLLLHMLHEVPAGLLDHLE